MKFKKGSNLLTPRQRGWIEGVARKAWRRLHDSGAIDEDYDAWRVREAIAKCGFRISEAPRAAFNDLLSHFLAAAGETGQAVDRLAGKGNEWNHWFNEIIAQLNRDHLPLAYADAIAAKYNHGRPMKNIGAPEMKTVFINVRNAVNARLRKKGNAEPAQAGA
jgi:hypothetical protein